MPASDKILFISDSDSKYMYSTGKYLFGVVINALVATRHISL